MPTWTTTSNEVLVEKDGDFYLTLKHLPSFYDLNDDVKKCVSRSTWWEKYGIDSSKIMLGMLFLVSGMYCMCYAQGLTLLFVCGYILYGTGHTIVTTKGGHLAAHNALVESKRINSFLTWFTSEFLGSFSCKAGIEIHIKYHHPYTNIIGLGDSSTWKLPLLPRYPYMFGAPLLMPLATPFVAISILWTRWVELIEFLLWCLIGLCTTALIPLVHFGHFHPLVALLIIFSARAMFSIPYIHFNIFQHIGLPMYSAEHRPVRLYQMSSAVLNLDRNPILDFVFGHSLINCHVEHHLFPDLSDNMCLKVKPIVSEFLRKYDLPYREQAYSDRLKFFLKNYEELMVDAPPMTHYVGLQ